jgi:hypothetical protein
MEAKEWMQSMAKAFGKYEYKVKYKAEAGTVELKSPGWREDPPNLKAYKAIDCILPEFLRTKKPQAKNKDKKKLVKQLTKYKENV